MGRGQCRTAEQVGQPPRQPRALRGHHRVGPSPSGSLPLPGLPLRPPTAPAAAPQVISPGLARWGGGWALRAGGGCSRGEGWGRQRRRGVRDGTQGSDYPAASLPSGLGAGTHHGGDTRPPTPKERAAARCPHYHRRSTGYLVTFLGHRCPLFAEGRPAQTQRIHRVGPRGSFSEGETHVPTTKERGGVE
jgi:hypothetical protein